VQGNHRGYCFAPGALLGTSAEFWLGLQLEYDSRTARQSHQREIEKAVRPRAADAYDVSWKGAE
jgi:plasmid maintenance system antidote protein VapI